MKEKKCILVTGASSETGMALIRKIGNRYEHVIGHYHTSGKKMKALADELGDKMISVQADFAEPDSVRAMTAEIRQRKLAVDHIVHLAAPKFHIQKFAKEHVDAIRREYTASAESAMIILQEFLKDMSRQKYGKVVFMLSLNVVRNPAKYQLSYTVSKYALLGLMKSIAAEYAERGITCNAVSPDMMETGFLCEIPELIVKKNAASSPYGRNLHVDEVIPAFEYLLSDGADKVTGVNISVNGGRIL